MFFLFGFRRNAKAVGQLDRTCSKCARPTVHTAVEQKRWFTLFFIPVIPLGTSHSVRCNVCGLTMSATPEVKTQLAARGMTAGA